jgi:hypothetical protein
MFIKTRRITVVINKSAFNCLNALCTQKVIYDIFAFKDLFTFFNPVVRMQSCENEKRRSLIKSLEPVHCVLSPVINME